MGLAASQARFLFLTARKTNLEYEAQQISQARMALAASSSDIAKAYTDALSNTKLFFNDHTTMSQDYPELTYENLTRSKYVDPENPEAPLGLGCRLIGYFGRIAVPELPSQAEMSKAGTNPSSYIVDASLKDPDYLSRRLKDGTYLIQEFIPDFDEEGDMTGTGKWSEPKSIPEVDGIVEKTNTADDALAEAIYSAQNQDLQQQDKNLELRLNQIQTEQKEVETELDAVASVLKKNTEVFKTTFNA